MKNNYGVHLISASECDLMDINVALMCTKVGALLLGLLGT